MNITVETIGPHNADLLENVEDGVFDHPVRHEYLEPFLAQPGHLLLVAMAEHSVIGMVTGILYTHPDKPLQLFVNEIGIAHRYRRRGVGRLLLSQILDVARARGCTEAWVATEEGNSAARALYESGAGREDPDRAVVYTWRLQRDG